MTPGTLPDDRQIPPQPVPDGISQEAVNAEKSDLSDAERLDLGLRRSAGYAALAIAVLLYAAGLFAVGGFVGLYPCWIAPAQPEGWHIVLAVVAALFSVPTFLLIGVLRSTGKSGGGDGAPASAVDLLVKVLEKLAKASKPE